MNDALLVIDMISTWDFNDAESVTEGAERPVSVLSGLISELRDQVPVVYANDMEGGFHGSRERSIQAALNGERPDLVLPLMPSPEDDFIHKGQHSAFYGTPLAHLLNVEEIDRVILTGQVTEQCVLYTALDAYVRGYDLVVIMDAVISSDEKLGDAALQMIKRNMHGELLAANELLRARERL